MPAPILENLKQLNQEQFEALFAADPATDQSAAALELILQGQILSDQAESCSQPSSEAAEAKQNVTMALNAPPGPQLGVLTSITLSQRLRTILNGAPTRTISNGFFASFMTNRYQHEWRFPGGRVITWSFFAEAPALPTSATGAMAGQLSCPSFQAEDAGQSQQRYNCAIRFIAPGRHWYLIADSWEDRADTDVSFSGIEEYASPYIATPGFHPTNRTVLSRDLRGWLVDRHGFVEARNCIRYVVDNLDRSKRFLAFYGGVSCANLDATRTQPTILLRESSNRRGRFYSAANRLVAVVVSEIRPNPIHEVVALCSRDLARPPSATETDCTRFVVDNEGIIRAIE